jgi:hypothetical protein
MFRVLGWCIFCASCALGATSLGLAQSAAAGMRVEPPGYREAVARGVEEYTHRNFTESREQFARAHALFPNARTLRGLGIAEYELRNYSESVRLLEQALASGVKPLAGVMREETQTLLARAKEYVGELRLDLEPEQAIVLIDGVTLERTPGAPLLLDVGDHLLEFRANGRLTERRAIMVKGGQSASVRVVLSALAPAATATLAVAAALQPAAPPQSAQSERTPVYARWWLWTAVGVAVAGAAVGVTFALRADPVTKQEPVTTSHTPRGAGLQALWSFP